MKEKAPDDEGYPDAYTRDILKWCGKVDEIKVGDDSTLPRLIEESPTRTLMGVYEHYENLLSDSERFHDEAFGEWEHEVRFALRRELLARGLVPLPAELAELQRELEKKSNPKKSRH
jgi:hypothetical protein